MCNEFTCQLQSIQSTQYTKGGGELRIEKNSQISCCRLSESLLFLKNKLDNIISHMNLRKSGEESYSSECGDIGVQSQILCL